MQHTFTIVIERDQETNWFVGSLVELPEVHTQAPDLQGLEANMREAIAAYLDTVALDDEEPLPEFVGTMRVTVPHVAPISA